MVAERFGVHPNTAKRWRRAWREGGEDALAAKPHPGGQRKLTHEQLDEVVELVIAGPLAAGFPTDLWTCDRVARLIRERFGVEYHTGHVARMLHELGFSPQKPRTVAREQDPDAPEHWRRVEWVRIKKKPADAAPASSSSTKRALCCSL
jgi:transposase